ncbi:uncharacterized protein [Antedon mediterranea]|uniref:uncharacterized protein n=1 Tax=Antedon mediterranea TaxID=105859 RepID=UPI003AF8B069
MVSCGRNLIDFANVLKAFIGSFYLSIAYWFSQCGLALSLICIVVIALATDYCTNLMIVCKYEIIDRLTIIDKDEQDITAEEKEHQNKERERIGRNLTYAEIANFSLGKKALYVVNAALFITQFGYTVQYIIFLGNTVQSLFPFGDKPYTNTSNVTDDGGLYPVVDNARVTTSPTYNLVVLIPIPFFMACSLLRDVRNLAPISLAGNAAVICGFFATLGIIYNDFHVADEIEYFKWAALPMLFGAVSGAFEGIGTVIPVEASMVGNRHMYPYFLHLTICILALILSSLGISGYLRYGHATQQIIIANLIEENDSIFLTIIYTLICISVMLTYPLQLFPVIEVIENALFLPGKIFGPKTLVVESVNGEGGIQEASETDALIKDKSKVGLAVAVPKSVSAWKRNLIRLLLICAEVGIAILFKDQYAYFGSIFGTIGASVLGYFLPPLIHIKLKRHQVWWGITALNVFLLTVFGVIGGSTSLGLGIKTIVDRMINNK